MRQQGRSTNYQRDIHRHGGSARRWALGGGLLSLHISVYLLAVIGLLMLNLYRTPDRIWVQRPLGVWGLLLLFHVGAVAIGWALATVNSQWRGTSDYQTNSPAVPTVRSAPLQKTPQVAPVASRFRPPTSATLAEVRRRSGPVSGVRGVIHAARTGIHQARLFGARVEPAAPEHGLARNGRSQAIDPRKERTIEYRILDQGVRSEQVVERGADEGERQPPVSWIARGDWPQQTIPTSQNHAAPVWAQNFAAPDRLQSDASGEVVSSETELTWMEAAATAWLLHRTSDVNGTGIAVGSEPEDRLIPPERPANHPSSQ